MSGHEGHRYSVRQETVNYINATTTDSLSGSYSVKYKISQECTKNWDACRILGGSIAISVLGHFGPLYEDRSDKGPKWMSRSVLRTKVETTKKGPNWTYILTRKLSNRKHYHAMPRQK